MRTFRPDRLRFLWCTRRQEVCLNSSTVSLCQGCFDADQDRFACFLSPYWRQHSEVSIFHFSYFFGFKSTKQYWVKLFGTKFVLLDTNQSTDSIQQIRISEPVDLEIFHHICRRTWIIMFYLCTDPLRAESQIRRDIKFVISILFEVSITSWGALLNFCITFGCLIHWVEGCLSMIPPPKREQFDSFALISLSYSLR